MIILLPKSNTYKMGNDFPLLTIPTEGENTQSGSFEDFQWWAYSKDFQNWLKQNPRQWVAESEEMKSYDSLTEFIKERFSYPILESLEQEQIDQRSGRVLSWNEFGDSQNWIHEAKAEEGQKQAQQNEISEAVKFHFAYNRMLSSGKIKKDFSPGELNPSSDSAVFLVVEDPESGVNVKETLKAYKMRAVGSVAENSKIVLADVTEMLPGGKIAAEDNPESVVQKAIQTGLAIGTAGLLGGGIYSAITYGGGALGARYLLKSISGFKRGGNATSTAIAGTRGPMKTVWGSIKNFGKFLKDTATLKRTRDFASAASSGYRGFKAAGATTGSALKAAFGMATKGGGKVASRLIPLVGEILLVVDAIGSVWNWYSTNQAPRYKEVDSFAQNEMDPKKIPIGVPITICWSQPAQSTFGSVLSFLANNETRTTCEMIKVEDNGAKSIFILTQINSKSLQKQLAEHDLVLISLDNSDIVNDQGGIINTVQRVFDNEDLDFQITYIDNLQNAASVLNFQGVCDWNELMAEYQSAPDQLIVANPKAPDTYQFYYKDPDGDIINVSGKLVQTSDLKETDTDKLLSMFFPEKDQSFKTKYTEEEKEEKVEDRLEAAKSESLEHPNLHRVISENGVITSLENFSAALYEDEAAAKAGENPGDPDAASSNDEMLETKDLVNPAEVMIYYVTEKAYANPELRKYALRGSKFTNFLIDDADISARDNEAITVEVNTVGGVNPKEPKRGIFTFVPEEEDENEDIESRRIEVQPDVEEQPEVGDTEEKPEPIITSPKDVKIKDRKNKITIRDRSVGDGVNILDEFLSDEEKRQLGITDWKAITFAKAKKDKQGEIDEVVLRNRFAPLGKRTKKYKIIDGETFELAKKFVEEADERIKYE